MIDNWHAPNDQQSSQLLSTSVISLSDPDNLTAWPETPRQVMQETDPGSESNKNHIPADTNTYSTQSQE